MANFFIRTNKKSGRATLYLRVQRPSMGISWKINTGIAVEVSAWRKYYESGNAKLWNEYTKEGSVGAELKKKMDKLAESINLLFDEHRIKSNDDKDLLIGVISKISNAEGIKAREELKQMERDAEEKRLRSIWNYYDEFLKGIKEGTIKVDGKGDYKKSTIKIWETFGKHMKSYTPEAMTFDEISKRFAEGFTVYLEKAGLMAKTVNKYVMCYRKLCNAAAIDEKNSNLISVKVWKEREVHHKEQKAEIALSDDEIDSLYNMVLTGTREKVRDMWILGYCCGQRLSDYSRLSRENFKQTPNGVDVITIRQQKTGEDVVIPIMDGRVYEICRKYDYDFPRFDDRVFNKQLKNVLLDLSKTVPSLREMVCTVLTMQERRMEQRFLSLKKRAESGENLTGYERRSYVEMSRYAYEHGSEGTLFKRDYSGRAMKERWELVGSHTARRSAVTSLYNTGLFDSRDIMSISGHKTMAHYENYIRRGAVEQAERIAEKMKKAKEIKLKKEV